jgi:hypothetical protein
MFIRSIKRDGQLLNTTLFIFIDYQEIVKTG